MKSSLSLCLLAVALGWSAFPSRAQNDSSPSRAKSDLWVLAQRYQPTHRYSTLFTAQNVRDLLANEAGIAKAIDWCQKTAVTHVYLEEFRDGYQADKETLLRAKERFQKAGIDTSGCITTTRVGKSSTGWKNTISCYTDPATQLKLKAIFEYAAGLFDEIMIDDFWFTDCTCPACDAARRARKVTIGDHIYSVVGDTWEDYRCELMVRLSRDYLLAAAQRVNPRVKLIIKYPQWYDRFHERGYEVVRETADFDKIWVGTETRDYNDPRWGGTVQYEAYFIMRWLGGLGGTKCGGGWFDPVRHHGTDLRRASPANHSGRRARIAVVLLRQSADSNRTKKRRGIAPTNSRTLSDR